MTSRAGWPASAEELVSLQLELARVEQPAWTPPDGPIWLGGVFVCFPRGQTGRGSAGDPAWAAAALVPEDGPATVAVVAGQAGAGYEAGLLALREGPLLEAAVRALPRRPDALFVDATARDHPRRVGLALHLGAALDLPTVGLTHRPLLATGPEPSRERGTRSPLAIDGEEVGCLLRTRAGARPLAVHPGWRTDLDTAVALVLRATRRHRTPGPLRLARQAARESRARSAR